MLACLSRRRSRVQIPSGAFSTGAASSRIGEAATTTASRRCPNLGDLRVRLPPGHLRVVILTAACKAVVTKEKK